MKLKLIGAILFEIIGYLAVASVLTGHAQDQQRAPNNVFPQWSHDGERQLIMGTFNLNMVTVRRG